MNERIDVLAVMDTHISGLRNASECGGLKFTASACKNVSAELLQARAAVAELIEATVEMNRLAKGPAGGVSQADKKAIVARVDEALARVGAP